MKKSFKVILGLIFVFTVVHNYAQTKSQKSKVIISEAEIMSLSNTLKKYSNTKNLEVNNSTKKELDSLNHRINELTELLSIQKDTNPSLEVQLTKADTQLDNIRVVIEKDIIPSNEKVSKMEEVEKTSELNILQQEMAELKKLISEVLDNQIKNSNSTVPTRGLETIIQEKPVFVEKLISKTDTVYVLTEKDGTKTIDSLNIKLLNVESKQLNDQQTIIDSLRNELFKRNLVVPKKLEQTIEVTTSKLYFNNNEFNLNEINTIILDEILYNNPTVKGKFEFYIKGFASNSGNANYNKILSNKRSQAVYQYLVLKGIEADAIKAESFGADYNEKNESKARRVEIEITKIL